MLWIGLALGLVVGADIAVVVMYFYVRWHSWE